MIDKHKEHVIGLYLNARLNVIKVELISLGTINTSIIHPREVFRPALGGNKTKKINIEKIFYNEHFKDVFIWI
ncbi:MAG: JAB domain-containing protein [Patescibacteria group bacterium]|nr:JAB domain-containing protein [Patescibacteria group bacterium]